MVLGLLPDVEVVGSAGDGDEAVALAADLLPDIVLMDLRMPRRDGAEATRLLRDRVPQTTVVVLTTYADDRSVIDALQAGARGYLTKDAGGAEISQALRQVLDNHAVIDPAVQHHVVDAIATGSPAQDPRPHSPLPAGLTPREAEVLSLIATGMSNHEIAEQLVVSEGTVKSHINHLLAKIVHATVPKQSPSPISADLPRPGNSPAESPPSPAQPAVAPPGGVALRVSGPGRPEFRPVGKHKAQP